MKKKLRITAIVEEVNTPANDPQFEGKPKEPSMEHDVLRALRQLGHEVTVLPVYDSIEPLVEGVEKNPPDLVFNLAEQFANDRRHDKNLAGLLEMMDIPFTGTGSVGLMLCRDKAMCKQLLATWKLNVPDFRVFPIAQKNFKLPRHLKFPMVVKPAYGDGSEGISNASLVKDAEELKERVSMIHERFSQDAIAEGYVEGREIYVGVLGNNRLTVLPPYEIRFGKPEEGPVLATYRVKWNKQYREKWNIEFGFAEVEDKLWGRIAETCRQAYRILQLRDYARMDLRVTADEKVYLIEANPNPDITEGEEMAEAARKAGISYKQFIRRILMHTLARQNSDPSS